MLFFAYKNFGRFCWLQKNSSKNILAPADLQEATIRAGLVYRSVNNAKFDAGHNDEICQP